MVPVPSGGAESTCAPTHRYPPRACSVPPAMAPALLCAALAAVLLCSAAAAPVSAPLAQRELAHSRLSVRSSQEARLRQPGAGRPGLCSGRVLGQSSAPRAGGALSHAGPSGCVTGLHVASGPGLAGVHAVFGDAAGA